MIIMIIQSVPPWNGSHWKNVDQLNSTLLNKKLRTQVS